METTNVHLCIDTPNRKALAAALKVVPGKTLVNFVNVEDVDAFLTQTETEQR